MAREVWVARLHISSRTADKLVTKHGLEPDDIRLHVQAVAGLRGAWSYHPERGRRLLLKVPIDGATVLVVLYPCDDPEEFTLGSAYPI